LYDGDGRQRLWAVCGMLVHAWWLIGKPEGLPKTKPPRKDTRGNKNGAAVQPRFFSPCQQMNA